MVFDNLTHTLWNTVKGLASEKKNETTEDKKKVANIEKKNLPFPQGARFLDYRENKNIRGLPFLGMSTSELSRNAAKAKYIDEISKRKTMLEETAEQSMQANLDNIEKFSKRSCVDRDAEYYRNLQKNTRMKQVAEQNVFYCLTGKSTNISEQNTLLFKNMPYTEYTKPDSKSGTPWELQPIRVKTSPQTLCDVKLIGKEDTKILG